MKFIQVLLVCFLLSGRLLAQEVYTIKADSTKLTGCDSNELIIENHTQAIKGFLYNTGNGRTIFQKGWIKLNDSAFIIGADTFRYNAWLQGGNSWGKTGILGTLDNNHLDFYTNGLQRTRITAGGNLLMGSTTDNGSKLQLTGSSYFNGNVQFAALASDTTQTRVLVSDASGNIYYRPATSLTPGSLTNAYIQGGNSFSQTGVLGLKDNYNLDIYTANTRRARFDSLGNLLIGLTTYTNPYRLDVAGSTRAKGTSTVTNNDAYDITLNSNYVFGTSGIYGSMVTFGNVYGMLAMNKSTLGAIASNSLLLGGPNSAAITAITDAGFNPVYGVNGWGQATINGGYNGILYGSTGTATDAIAFNFTINGPRGTGAGTLGDIVIATGNAQPSGTTPHSLTNRWWIKGGTGYLSNVTGATSTVDITGANGYSQFRMRTTYTPGSTSDTNGNTGDFSWDANYLYVKTASGWKRAALTTF